MTARKRKYEQIDEKELTAFQAKVEKLQLEGMTTTDIAARLGLHRNTVNQRLRDARRKTRVV